MVNFYIKQTLTSKNINVLNNAKIILLQKKMIENIANNVKYIHIQNKELKIVLNANRMINIYMIENAIKQNVGENLK